MKWRAFVKEVETILRSRGVAEEDMEKVAIDTIYMGNIAVLTGIIDIYINYSNYPDEIRVSIK